MAEVIEQDTIHSEDTLNIADFVRDGMPSSDTCLQEGVLYNRKLFNGWMKQPSACCAAASVAGAFNALACHHRAGEGALTHLEILLIFESIMNDIILKHKRSYERLLGAPIDAFLVTLEEELLKLDKEIGGKKGSEASMVSVIKIIKRVCRDRFSLRSKFPLPPKEGPYKLNLLYFLLSLIIQLRRRFELSMYNISPHLLFFGNRI